MFLSAGMMMTGLDKRIALIVMSHIGVKSNRLVIGVIFVGFLLSFFVPSTTARVSCMVPIVIGIIRAFGLEKGSTFAGVLMMAVAQADSLWNEADLRQHHEHDTGDGDSRRIKGMQLLLCDPEKEQRERDAEELLFRQGDGSHFLQHLIQCFLPAGHFFHFRRHDMDQKEIENDRHDGCIRSGCDEPFQPADVLT